MMIVMSVDCKFFYFTVIIILRYEHSETGALSSTFNMICIVVPLAS